MFKLGKILINLQNWNKTRRTKVSFKEKKNKLDIIGRKREKALWDCQLFEQDESFLTCLSECVEHVDLGSQPQQSVHQVVVGEIGGDVKRSQQLFVLLVEVSPLADQRLDHLFPLGVRRHHRAVLQQVDTLVILSASYSVTATTITLFADYNSVFWPWISRYFFKRNRPTLKKEEEKNSSKEYNGISIKFILSCFLNVSILNLNIFQYIQYYLYLCFYCWC